MLWLAAALLIAALLFYALENMLLAVILGLAAFFAFLGTLLYKSGKYTGRKAKKAASDISKEVEEAEPSYPSKELIGEGLNELGKKAGDHLWEEKKVWTASSKGSGARERAGKSSKKFIDKFLELFK